MGTYFRLPRLARRQKLFKNYVRVAVRNLSQDYVYTLINLTGLSLGLACFLVLALHLESELTYDRHFQNHENIYRVVNELNTSGKIDFSAITSRELGPLLKADYDEVIDFVRFFPSTSGGQLILRGKDEQYYWDNVFLADENIFNILRHEIIYGDPESALKDPLAIAISETMSKRYFGNRNPIGETLSTDTASYKVTLVFADLPDNTHLQYPALLSYNRLKAFFGDTANVSQALWNISDYTYLLMRPDMKPAAFNTISTDFFDRYMSENGQQFNSVWRFFIEPLAEIHLNSETTYDEPRGNRFYVYAFSIIACLVLLIACINYMNLATARSINRAKEIGMRKIIGAHKEQIVMQFLGESLVFTFISLVIALGLTYLVAAYTPVSSLLGKPLEFDIYRPSLLAFLLILGLTVSLISGMYPAFHLSAIKPISALRAGKGMKGRGVNLRQVLVFLQFMISIGVIACTILMAIQIHYIQTKPLGFSKENKVLVTLRGADLIEKIPTLRNDLLANRSVLGVAFAESVPGLDIPINIVEVDSNEGKKESMTFNRMGVDENFFEVMEIKLLQGRTFGPNTPPNSSIMINEAVVERMGWEDPIGKRVKSGPFENQVIGVVRDFHVHSLHRPVEPLFLHMTGYDFSEMNELNRRVVTEILIIHIADQNIPETLSFLQSKFSEFDPTHPFEYEFLDELLDKLYVSEKRQMTLIAVFASVCILISCLGLFGLASFTTAQRTKEIGIRRLLGASRQSIIILLFKDIVGLILIAAVFASAVSYYVISTWLSDFQYKEDINLLVFLLATSIALAVAFLTVALQSYKTASANPGIALRYEQ